MSVVTTTQLSFIELNPLFVLLTSVIDEKNKKKHTQRYTVYVEHVCFSHPTDVSRG